MFRISTFLILLSIISFCLASRRIVFRNYCSHPVWIEPESNFPFGQIKKINPNKWIVYNTPDGAWNGQFRPKVDCNGNGQNCRIGGKSSGDTLALFKYPNIGSQDKIDFGVSLAEGYSLPMKITPLEMDIDRCLNVFCKIPMEKCPSNENHVGDLRIMNNGNVASCQSPCKKWTNQGHSESEGVGKEFCISAPVVTFDTSVDEDFENTKYFNLVRGYCGGVYSHKADDYMGSYSCKNPTNFVVKLCY